MGRRGWVRRWVLGPVFGIVAALLIVALLEGLVSLAFVGRTALARTGGALGDPERPMISSFDADLGWCMTRDFNSECSWSRGLTVTTNAQGFRGPRPFERAVPAGKVRMLCSGDSFTFGTGVADERAWCDLLQQLEPRLQTVNLGVGGYGIDQAYLRYVRDAAALDHGIHLFAFITEGLRRAVVPAAWGAEKPRLVIEGEELRVTGTPVRHVSSLARSLKRAGGPLSELKLVQAAERLTGGGGERQNLAEDDEAQELALRIFAELKKLAEARGTALVLLHLPVETERGGGSIDVLRHTFSEEAQRCAIGWIDLIDEFRALPKAQHDALFLRKPSPAAGHYSDAGNAFVAEHLLRKLRAIPAVRERLEGAER